MNLLEDELLVEIGKKIKAIRRDHNITQQHLADLCNFEKSNLCRIESGRSNVTIKTLLTISTALEVDIIELIPR